MMAFESLVCFTVRATWSPSLSGTQAIEMTDSELTSEDFNRSIRRSMRGRLMAGNIRGGDDIVALRRFVGLTQEAFAAALCISIHTLRNWEQDRRHPEGPGLALLRIAARHPRVLKENLTGAARRGDE
jgi:DNA-binding transcriptional regulator YiaG